ncbi:MAG: NPCBM/NEW2 domain-containing protein [Planctomycetia bacterium]|nr:NPCBM/NEW2 domain-containing protein [Planctomycetia bacterium]
MKKWILIIKIIVLLFLGNLTAYVTQGAEVTVTVQPAEGTVISGKFSGFDGEKVLLKSETELPTDGFTIRTLKTLIFQNEKEIKEVDEVKDAKKTEVSEDTENGKNTPETWKVTAGESIFQALSVTKSGREFHIKLPNSKSEVVAEQGKIQEILFQETKLGKNVDLDADWTEIQALEMPSDLLVVLRNEKLSYYYGTVLEITEKALRFEQEGESLNVKLKHVFALRFMAEDGENKEGKTLPNTEKSGNSPLLGMLTDSHGNHLMISTLKLIKEEGKKEENAENSENAEKPESPRTSVNSSDSEARDEIYAEMITVSGIHVTLPVSTLKMLDFTAGRAIFLSDMMPEMMKWTPYFSAGSVWQKEKLSVSQTFYHPQRDRSFNGEKITLNGKEYARGMVLASQTRLVFRLPGKFQTFTTILGIDDVVRPNGNADVTILADEKVIFQEKITGKDEPKTLSLPISGVRRLTLLVDYGEEGSFSDFIVFADAQLKK